VTVKSAYLSQHLEELDPSWRVLEAVEHIASRVDLGKGRELTASQLCERLGFGTDGQWTPVGDLSGGERRRLQLTRLLMSGPNVLVLDEPTNDFDVETLTALEDLLDGFAGTLLVISHDRYFLERVCDDFVALLGDERILGLTGGIDEYLERRQSRPAPAKQAAGPPPESLRQAAMTSADRRSIEKEVSRIERSIAKLDEREAAIHAAMVEQSADHERLSDLNRELHGLRESKADLEAAWLEAAERLG
jgi:ATP-binding cassette subfamily F protein uup